MPKAKIAKESSKRGGRRPGTGGKRPGAGRPPLASQAERDAIAAARAKGRSALPELMELALEATKATKVEFVKDEAGWAPVGDAPDWPVRLRAMEFVANRCGLPAETKVDAPTANAALAALVKGLADGLPDDPSST